MIVNKIRLNDEKKDPKSQLRATALGYDMDRDAAPRVLATGRGKIAQQIIDLAVANGIPLREDPILAAALANIDVNEEIPPELYAVVAEVFAYIYRIRDKRISR
jgi:flagellar biosynthesis protein